MFRKLLIFWELPQFILAVLILVTVRKRIKETIKYRNSKIYLVKGFPGGLSLSFIIFLNSRKKSNLRIIKHEYGHTLQSLILGWLYLLIVGLPSITRAMIWSRRKLEEKKYYCRFPENWADLLGRAEEKIAKS